MSKLLDSLLTVVEAEKDEMKIVGLRSTHSRVESKIGHKHKVSSVWIDGRRTSKRLDGTSSISVPNSSKDEVIKAIQRLGPTIAKKFGVPPKTGFSVSDYWNDMDVVLISGDSGHGGEDAYEMVIRDAVTVWSMNRAILAECMNPIYDSGHRNETYNMITQRLI